MRQFFILGLIYWFNYSVVIAQSPRWNDRFSSIPVSVLNLDPQSAAFGGILVVAPLHRSFVQKEGNPALFHESPYQIASHVNNWNLNTYNGDDTFLISQIQASTVLRQKHQVGFGIKLFLPDSTVNLAGEAHLVLNDAKLAGQQFSLNYSYKMNETWRFGLTANANSWLFAAKEAYFRAPLAVEDFSRNNFHQKAWGLSMDVGLHYHKSILLRRKLMLDLQSGFSLQHLGPPMRLKDENTTLLADYLPLTSRLGGMMALKAEIPETPLILHIALAYEWEHRLLYDGSYPADPNYFQSISWGLLYGYPGALHKIGAEISLEWSAWARLYLRGGGMLPYETATVGAGLEVKGFFMHMAYQSNDWTLNPFYFFGNRMRWSWGYRRTLG